MRTFPLIGLIGYAMALLSGTQLLPLTFGFGVTELDKLGAPLQRMAVLLNDECAAQIAAEEGEERC